MDKKLLTDWLYEGSYEEPMEESIYTCYECGNDIYSEEYYYELCRQIICQDCIDINKRIASED